MSSRSFRVGTLHSTYTSSTTAHLVLASPSHFISFYTLVSRIARSLLFSFPLLSSSSRVCFRGGYGICFILFYLSSCFFSHVHTLTFSVSLSLCPSLSLFCCASLGLWGMGRGWTLDVFGLGFLGCLLGVGSWELTWTFYKYVVIFSGLGVHTIQYTVEYTNTTRNAMHYGLCVYDVDWVCT